MYYPIVDIDQCLLQMNCVDQLLSLKNIRYCSNRYSVFNHLFIKSKQKIEKSKSTIDFYGHLNEVNIYSKIHMLNEFSIDFHSNKPTLVDLHDYCMLRKFINVKRIIN